MFFSRIYVSVCFGGQHEKQLLHTLLDSYNTLERPVANESDPLQLSFGLTLMQIIDVVSFNESSPSLYIMLKSLEREVRWAQGFTILYFDANGAASVLHNYTSIVYQLGN